MLCFHFFLAQTSHCGTTHLPYKLPGHPSVTWVTLNSVQSGCAVFVFQVHVPLATVCLCAAHTCSSCHSWQKAFAECHCEPGTPMSSVICVLMLLWGLLLCSFVPKLLPLCQSGVSGSVYFLPCTLLLLPPPSVPAPTTPAESSGCL